MEKSASRNETTSAIRVAAQREQVEARTGRTSPSSHR